MIARTSWISDGEKVEEDHFKNLNWKVEKHELKFDKPISDTRKRWYGTGINALVRSDDNSVLGTVKNRYEIFQNQDIIEWTKPLTEEGFWKHHSSGSFENGKANWMLLNHDESEIIPKDILQNYLCVAWFHDGMRANVVLPTSIRIICKNTFNSAIRGRGTENESTINRIVHKDIVIKYEEVQQYWLQMTEFFTKRNEMFKALTDVKMTDLNLEKYVDVLYPVTKESSPVLKNRNNRVKQMVFGDASGHKELGIINTGYGAFQAVSEYIEHEQSTKVAEQGNYILFGNGKTRLVHAFEEINKFNKTA